MTLTFLLDEDISQRVAAGLRQRGVDALSVHELGRAGRSLTDEDQLTFAAQARRVLVTYNRADYEALDGIWRAQEQTHAGILWCAEKSIPRRAIGDLVERFRHSRASAIRSKATASPYRDQPIDRVPLGSHRVLVPYARAGGD